MEISPLYQILIYLEDKGSSTQDEIKDWGIAVSRGVLGKMEAMHLIEKNVEEKSKIKLSRSGYAFLNSILDQIHREIAHWDGRWRMVGFSIPESHRSKRDKFRRYLESLGMKPVLNSFWISPLDLKSKVTRYIEQNGLLNSVIYIETDIVCGLDLSKILSAWDFDKFRKLYEDFMVKSDALLKQKDLSSFEKKKLIFEYASILNCEPQLPIELLPNDWPRFRASLFYKKIRRSIS